MTGYLIDTNVISEMRRQKPHGGVLAWLESLAVDQGFFSAVTFGEIREGLLGSHAGSIRRKPMRSEAWGRESGASLAGPRHGRSMFSRICQIDPRPLFGSFRGRYDRRHCTRAWPHSGDAKRTGFCVFLRCGLESLSIPDKFALITIWFSPSTPEDLRPNISA